MKRVHRQGWLGVAAIGIAAGTLGQSAGAADAPTGSPVAVYLGQGFTYDSNVFKRSSASSDWFSTTRAGVVAQTEQSLQRLRANAEVNYNKFHRFDQLDHSGRNLLAAWDWRVSNRWFGEARAQQTVLLTPFQDFRVTGTNPERSTTTVNDFALSGNYWLVPDWSAGLGVGHTEGNYSAAALKPAEYEVDYGELITRYRPPTGSEVVFRYRRSLGDYPNRVNPTDSKSFTQDDLSVASAWAITAASRIEGSLGLTRRRLDDYVDPSQRPSNANFTGVTGRIAYDWRATAATSLNVSLARATQPVQNTDADFAVATTLSIIPTWAVTERLRVQGRFEELWRDLRGGASNGQSDQLETIGVTVFYLPVPRFETSLGAMTQRRKADNAALEFRANTIFISGRYTFF